MEPERELFSAFDKFKNPIQRIRVKPIGSVSLNLLQRAQGVGAQAMARFIGRVEPLHGRAQLLGILRWNDD